VIGTVPLTSAETAAVLAVAGGARIAPQAMDHPDQAVVLHDLDAAIDDALDHALYPDHTLAHVLGARRREGAGWGGVRTDGRRNVGCREVVGKPGASGP